MPVRYSKEKHTVNPIWLPNRAIFTLARGWAAGVGREPVRWTGRKLDINLRATPFFRRFRGHLFDDDRC